MLSALLRITYILLLVLGIAGLFWFAPPDAPTFAGVIMAAVLYGPLALMAAAPITLHPRSLTWLCFLLLFYFCGYVVQCLNPPPVRTLAIAKTSLTVMLFVFSALQIRQGQNAD